MDLKLQLPSLSSVHYNTIPSRKCQGNKFSSLTLLILFKQILLNCLRKQKFLVAFKAIGEPPTTPGVSQPASQDLFAHHLLWGAATSMTNPSCARNGLGDLGESCLEISSPRLPLALKFYDSVPFDRMEFQFPGGHLRSFQGICKCTLLTKLVRTSTPSWFLWGYLMKDSNPPWPSLITSHLPEKH